MVYRAFVSSTFTDLEAHRNWAIEALLAAGFSVDPMERWTADAGEPKQVSQERVDGCDLCILLVGFRQGFVPEGSQLSITQMEYARALEEEGCDVLAFLLNNEVTEWPREFDDRQHDPLVDEWRTQLEHDYVVGYFDENPESLNIAPALTRWVQQREGLQVKRVPLGLDLLNIDKQTKIEVIVSRQRVEEEDENSESAAGLGPNPYKGLAAFHEEDAERYFGRRKQIDRLWERFRELNEGEAGTRRVLPVLGPSGSGKSSLVRAGLIPELARKPLAGKERVRVLVFTPGMRPLWMLAGLLAKVADRSLSNVMENDRCLRTANDSGVFDGLQRSAELVPKIDSSPLILVVDRFEEIYAPDVDEEERQAFIDNLLVASGDRSGRVSVVLTLRSDFLGQTHRHPELNETIAAQEITIPAMSAEELEEAIAKPAENAGRGLDVGTVAQLVSETVGREGALPLLQFALQQIWEGLAEGKEPAQTLKEIGGVRGAVANKAQQIYESLGDRDQEIARRVFQGLVQLGEGAKDTRRRVEVETLRSRQDDPVLFRATIERFIGVSSRLITLSATSGGVETAEVTHEALFEHWQQLNDWLDRNRDDIRFQRRLDDAVVDWDEKGRPGGNLWRPPNLDLLRDYRRRAGASMTEPQELFYKASNRAERFRRIGVSAIGIGLVALAGSATWLAFHANRQTIEAENQTVEALVQASLANLEADRVFESLAMAIRAGRAQQEAKNANPEILNQVKAALLSSQARGHWREFNRFEGHTNWLWAVEFSPDGTTLASGSADGTVRLWQADGMPIATLEGHTEQVLAVEFSPDGNTLASASTDDTVRLWRADGTPIATLEGHTNRVSAVEFSPDGTTLASAGDRTVRLWQADGTPIATLEGHTNRVSAVEFSPDGTILASASDDDTVRLWQTDGTPIATLEGHTDRVSAVEFSPDGNTLASASSDGTVRLWQADGTLIDTLEGHTDRVSAVEFSPDGNTLASASDDGTVRLWQTDGTPIDTLEGHTAPVRAVEFSPDGNTLASVSSDRVRLWQADGTPIDSLEGRTDRDFFLAVEFSPDGNTLVSTSFDGTVRLWQVGGTPIDTLEGHTDWVSAVEFSPDGNTLASASFDGTVRLWQADGTPIDTLEGHTDWVSALEYSPDGTTLASASRDNTVRLWQADGTPIDTLEGHTDGVRAVEFSPDGNTLASASLDGTVRLWQTDGTPIDTLEGHADIVVAVEFSHDGNTLVSASSDGTVRLWQTDGTPIDTVKGHTIDFLWLEFSPDGNTLASASSDGTLRLWQVDGTPIDTLEGHTQIVWSVEFSPDGNTLASASEDLTVRLWQADGTPIDTLEGHTDYVNAVEFSPDGKTLASASSDGTVRLWQADGTPIDTLAGHTDQVSAVEFSPDGTTLASAGENGTVRLWDWNLDSLVQHGCDWLGDYFRTNPNVDESDRRLCEDLPN